VGLLERSIFEQYEAQADVSLSAQSFGQPLHQVVAIPGRELHDSSLMDR
jgi:hypothetical protein